MNKNINMHRSIHFIFPLFTNIGDWDLLLVRESLLNAKDEISQVLFFNTVKLVLCDLPREQ